MTALVNATPTDRALAALRKLVLSALPALRYWIVHEYSVIESDGNAFSAVPTDATFSPALPVGVPYSPSLAGSFALVPEGTLAYVGFANADPAKPYLVRFAQVVPTDTTIDNTATMYLGTQAQRIICANATPVATAPLTASAERRVVCYGDRVNVGIASGEIVLLSADCSRVRA